MDEVTDGELIRRMLDGDERACDAFVRRWYGAVHAVALAVLRHPEDARDAAQEALVRVLRHIDQLADPESCGPWIHAVARNCALSLHKRRRRAVHVRVEDVCLADPAQAPDEAHADALLQALSGLREVERMVVLLHDMEGLQHAEIARNLKISETNSRQLLFVARRKMRAWLGEESFPREADDEAR